MKVGHYLQPCSSPLKQTEVPVTQINVSYFLNERSDVSNNNKQIVDNAFADNIILR